MHSVHILPKFALEKADILEILGIKPATTRLNFKFLKDRQQKLLLHFRYG